MKEIINVDFVCVVYSVGHRLAYKKVPISNPYKEYISILKEMVGRDDCNILDMQDYFKRNFIIASFDKTYDYCYPNDYKSSHNNVALYPRMICKVDYEKEIEALKISKKEELVKKRAPYENIHKMVEKTINIYIVSLKDSFYQQASRFIFAYYYSDTLSMLKKETGNLMFSTENIGWTDYDYKINNNISFHLKTNFGYGSSSYLLVNLKYRGIDILPYSYIVRYYYANMLDFIRCTRMYVANRDNWETAFKFVTETTNRAIADERLFVGEWIISEIDKMMSGLREIAQDPEVSYERMVNLDLNTCGLKYIRNISNDEKDAYEIYSHESVIAYQAEKISGALLLLDNLRNVSEVFHEVLDVTDEIMALNKKLYPQFQKALDEIKYELSLRQEKIDSDILREKELKAYCKPHLEAIHKLIHDPNKKIFLSVNEWKAEYKRTHEDFTIASKELEKLSAAICSQWVDIYKRRSFADRLSVCIERYKDAL